ncbi:hypothetical protein ACPWT1_00995 [Ramlibacter sp. MMS24-I3-19]|uniref:hypothetical protein n=1 Tax=Ramlibacter sp. MMS24-I3-19 TaxID=3416606 RepID=UPI003D0755D0
MKSLWKWAAVSSATALLVSCGGGGGGDTQVAVANGASAVKVDATNGSTAVQAMSNQPITFASGVPDFGTTGSTTVTIAPPASGTAAPTFSIASGGATASGDMTFGSCIFTVKSSTFPAGSTLATGAKITVSPCSISLATNGVPATGVAVNVSVTLTLNSVTSTPYTETVSVSPAGAVSVNGQTVVTVKVGALTGA